MIQVVTAFSGAYFHTQGGRNFLHGFSTLWPQEVTCWAYTEDPFPKETFERVEYRHLFEDAPAAEVFHRRYANDPEKNGSDPQYGHNHNAVTFSKKVYALAAAAHRMQKERLLERDKGRLYWLDADTSTHARPALDWLHSLVPDGVFCAYLGRETIYTEGGFYGFNLNHRLAADFFPEWQRWFDLGQVFTLEHQHDCGTFDAIRKSLNSPDAFANLSPVTDKPCGHPFPNSPLGRCFDHMKGRTRKQLGHSLSKDLKVERVEPYWQGIVGSR